MSEDGVVDSDKSSNNRLAIAIIVASVAILLLCLGALILVPLISTKPLSKQELMGLTTRKSDASEPGDPMPNPELGDKRLPSPDLGTPRPPHVSPDSMGSLIVKVVKPNYPPLAQQARIHGKVVLDVVIDKEGNITNVRLVSGHPMLASAAIDAVRQWKCRPYLLEGKPVEVQTEVTVNFSPSH